MDKYPIKSNFLGQPDWLQIQANEIFGRRAAEEAAEAGGLESELTLGETIDTDINKRLSTGEQE